MINTYINKYTYMNTVKKIKLIEIGELYPAFTDPVNTCICQRKIFTAQSEACQKKSL